MSVQVVLEGAFLALPNHAVEEVKVVIASRCDDDAKSGRKWTTTNSQPQTPRYDEPRTVRPRPHGLVASPSGGGP